jgi:hypothetical protein
MGVWAPLLSPRDLIGFNSLHRLSSRLHTIGLIWTAGLGTLIAIENRGSGTPRPPRPRTVRQTGLLVRPTGVQPTRTHSGVKAIPIEGADDWEAATMHSAWRCRVAYWYGT